MVQQDDIGGGMRGGIERFIRGSALSHHTEIGFRLHQAAQGFAQQNILAEQEQADWFHGGLRFHPRWGHVSRGAAWGQVHAPKDSLGGPKDCRAIHLGVKAGPNGPIWYPKRSRRLETRWMAAQVDRA